MTILGRDGTTGPADDGKDRWTLRAADRALLGNKSGATRLGFAVGSVRNLGLYAASWIAGWPNRPSSTAALT